jgi:hypothetical protein
MKNWTRAALVLCLLSAAIACSKSDGDIPDTRASLLVFNMIPGSAKFDVLLDTVALGSNLAYGDNSGRYRDFRAQKYDLLVYEAGNHTTPVMGGELNLTNGKHLSAFLTVDSKNRPGVLLTEDDITPSPTPTLAKMRIVDLSDPYRQVGTGGNQQQLPLDIYLDYKDKSSVPVYKAVTYFGVTAPAEITAASHSVDFNWTDSSKTLQSVPFTAEAGKVYTLIATGDPKTTAFKMFQYVNN